MIRMGMTTHQKALPPPLRLRLEVAVLTCGNDVSTAESNSYEGRMSAADRRLGGSKVRTLSEPSESPQIGQLSAFDSAGVRLMWQLGQRTMFTAAASHGDRG
jgi:hypothetical protein